MWLEHIYGCFCMFVFAVFARFIFPLWNKNNFAFSAEHPYELFMYLHLLIKNIFPSWLEIFAMAERVMDNLQSEDMELFTHLQRSFQRGVIFNSEVWIFMLTSKSFYFAFCNNISNNP